MNQLLSKIDGVNALNNILVIGMTNRKDLLDEALLRPGRLEVHVEIVRSFSSLLQSPSWPSFLFLIFAFWLSLFVSGSSPMKKGKLTLIARQIGKMLNGREPKIVNGPEVLNKYVGQSEENIRLLFQEAEADYKENGESAGLHIIIFDEIDAICKVCNFLIPRFFYVLNLCWFTFVVAATWECQYWHRRA